MSDPDRGVKSHLTAVLLALFVVFLWATSWVFIKVGLQDLPPLTFAGLRYVLAFLCLLPVYWTNPARLELKNLSRPKWIRLLLLGLFYYAATQGASFAALNYLPAVTVNLLWNFSSVVIALLGIVLLSERPSASQWGGISIALLGAVIFFFPVRLPGIQLLGLLAALIGVLSNAISSILGRGINRSRDLHPLTVTVVSMGFGSVTLLVGGLILEGLPIIDSRSWAIIAWLAIVNTALAFTLWNQTLRTLSAVESSVINSTMLIWIPIFAVLFLGENITGKEILGLVVAGAGTLLVQLRRRPGYDSREV